MKAELNNLLFSRFLSIFISCYFLFGFYTFSQDSINPIKLSELTFVSDFEKETFLKFKEKKSDPLFALDLFLAISPAADKNNIMKYKSELEDKIKYYSGHGLSNKSETKQIKYLYKEIHSTYFKKYELKNHFNEIFENGRFNCVSASALYGVLFSRIGIPFIIKEKPNHIYLIAYPETSRILVESTAPENGYFVYDNTFKNNFVTSLKDSKIISEDEFKSGSINNLFDKYYFEDKPISLTQLAGLQYYNDALYFMEEKKYEQAFHQLEKACFLYPCERIIYTITNAGANMLIENGYNSLNNVTYLIKMFNLNTPLLTKEHIIDEFKSITNTHLFNSSNPEHYDSIYYRLNKGITDSLLKSEIAFIYYYERGRILYNQGSNNKSLEFIEKGFDLKKENIDAQLLLVNAIVQKIQHLGDPILALKYLEEIENKHVSLKEVDKFNAIKCQVYLLLAGQYYEMNKPSDADKYKTKFEETYSQNKDVVIDENLIGMVYSRAASVYFRAGNTAKTKLTLKKGLEYSPNNYELTKRLELIK